MIELGPKLKSWADGTEMLDESTRLQCQQITLLDEVGPHVALMADAHYGIGGPVGGVIPTRDILIPSLVGVDIGCGMTALRTSLKQDKLPDSLKDLYHEFEIRIPVGKEDWGHTTPSRMSEAFAHLVPSYHTLVEKHKLIDGPALDNQLGTLGGGNHFVELSVDEDGFVWVVLHSGSRGVGNRIGRYFIDKAKEEIARKGLKLPDKDLSYFAKDEPLFNDYADAVEWAQSYAHTNRQQLLISALAAMRVHLPDFSQNGVFISCHHNYVKKETHFGKSLWITRKGAISAKKEEKGIIPGSMGDSTFIVEGLGNPQSFTSSSHGAGRRLSRGRAKVEITVEQHEKDTEGVECRKDAGVLDESPRAYKPIHQVMAAQKDLVKILHELTPILSLKG